MSGHVKSQLSAYLAGGLMESQKRLVDAHLAECEKCRQYLSKLRAKEARSKRDALKSATPQQGQNLFVSRISRQQAPLASPPSPMRRWMFIPLFMAVLVWAGIKWDWLSVFSSMRSKPDAVPEQPAVEAMSPSVAVSTAPAEPLATAVVEDPKDAAAASRVAVSTVAAVPEPPKHRQWKGSFCLIKDHREMIVRNRDDWRTLWHEMNGEDSKTPRVDFEQQLVVGVFLGEKPVAGYTVSLLPAKEENGQIVVRYVVTEPAADQQAAAVIVHPYHLITIPKTNLKIIFVKGAAS